MATITLNNIDKSNWKPFPFEKIAKRISESVDPNKTELEVYIGLEHLDAETVHIRRHGSPADVSGGKLKCYPGDVIFGKRRAYQRKAGIVTQEGICSAHSFVFRANEEVIDARLFPFFLHSDQFMHRMVDISVGGLSPTINWSDLKHQEFLLPPKAQQAELAELLWAMDNVIEKDLEVLERLELVKSIEINSLKNLEQIEAQTLFNINWGNTNITKASYVSQGYIAFSASGPDGYLPSYEIDADAIVLSAIGADCGKCFRAFGKWTAIKNTITIIPKFESIDMLNLYFEIFNNKKFWPSTGGAQPFIKQETARKLSIPDFYKIDYKLISNRFYSINVNKNNLESKLQSSKALQKALINQVF